MHKSVRGDKCSVAFPYIQVLRLPTDHIKADCRVAAAITLVLWMKYCEILEVIIHPCIIHRRVPGGGRGKRGEGGRVRKVPLHAAPHYICHLGWAFRPGLPSVILVHAHTRTGLKYSAHTERVVRAHIHRHTLLFPYKPLWSLRCWFSSNMALSQSLSLCMLCASKPGVLHNIWTLLWILQLWPEASGTLLTTRSWA